MLITDTGQLGIEFKREQHRFIEKRKMRSNINETLRPLACFIDCGDELFKFFNPYNLSVKFICSSII